jgi:hypothetical protein
LCGVPNLFQTIIFITGSFKMTISRPYPLTTYCFLAPVRVVSTANIAGTYFNGTTNNGVGSTYTVTATGQLTIDSVALNINDYVLLAGQTLGYENGIYQVTNNGTGGANPVLQRRTDFQNIEQMQLGAFTTIYAGTVNAGSIYSLIEPFPSAIGVPTVSGSNNINFGAVTAS